MTKRHDLHPIKPPHGIFVLQGFLDVFGEDESGKRLTTRLGPWECISCPAGVIHCHEKQRLAPVYFQVMLGQARPEAVGHADEKLYERREAHLKAESRRDGDTAQQAGLDFTLSRFTTGNALPTPPTHE
jgi:hypothetical protein